jgi:hypothetical protein
MRRQDGCWKVGVDHPRGWEGIIMWCEVGPGKEVLWGNRVMLWGVVWTGRYYYTSISSNICTLCDKWFFTEYIFWMIYWCKHIHGMDNIKKTVLQFSLFLCMFFWHLLCIRLLLSKSSSTLRYKNIFMIVRGIRNILAFISVSRA